MSVTTNAIISDLATQEAKDKAQSFYEDMGDIALEQK